MPSSFLRDTLAPGAPRSIRFRIITLVLLILLPFLAIFGWTTFNLASVRMILNEMQRVEVSKEISARADIEIAEATGKLRGLAATVDLNQSDDSFGREVRGLLNRAEIMRVWLLDEAGATLADVTPPSASHGASTLDGSTTTRTLAGETVVSGISRGEGASEATFIISVPVIRSGKVVAGVAAEFNTKMLNTVFDIPLQERWIAAIVDRRGVFVARSLAPERWVGHQARPELGEAARGKASFGTFENVSREGEPVLSSFRRSSLTGWTTFVAVPSDLVNAPIQRSVLIALLVGTSALALTLGAALAYARRISEPVRTLGRMARAFITGKPVDKSSFKLTELEEVKQAFETATGESAHLSALVASSGDAIMSMDLEGIIRTWNPAAEQLFGYTAEEMIGQPKSVLVPSEVIEDYRRQQREVAAGNNMRSETIRLHKNGTPIPVSVDAAPIRRPDGRVIATSSILHDITDRIANEEHRQFLMREITHRSKNQLAIIQSIATQTARASGTKQEFLDQFRNRLQGLSASHDLLLKQDWRGAPLDELIHRQLEVFVGNRSDAVTLQGPATMLTAAAAEAIGLAIHELATNSAKYGALSVPTGRVEVTWRQTTVDPDQQDGWEISWCELGGPKVTAPTSTGFGTQVIKRMVAVVVNGRAELDYPESGLVWRLTFPAPAMKLVDRAKENHADRAAAPSG